MSQLVHKIGSAAAFAADAAVVEGKNEGISSAFCETVMGKISYSKRHWLWIESTSGPTVAPVRKSLAVVVGLGRKSMVADPRRVSK